MEPYWEFHFGLTRFWVFVNSQLGYCWSCKRWRWELEYLIGSWLVYANNVLGI